MTELSQASGPATVSAPGGTEAPRSCFRWDRLGTGQGLVLIALGACWFLFFHELRDEWQDQSPI